MQAIGGHRRSVVSTYPLGQPPPALARVQMIEEGRGWSVLLPGLPVAVDASTKQEAVAEMVDALREYAEDWVTGLHRATNHRVHEDLVRFVRASSDEQLRRVLLRTDH